MRRISRPRDQGESLRAIAEELNRDGIETKRGGEWHASTVKYVLDNPKYDGRLRHSFAEETVERDAEHLRIE